MIATVILLYFMLVYFFELDREIAFKVLLTYSVLNLAGIGIIVLLFGTGGKIELVISVLLGI